MRPEQKLWSRMSKYYKGHWDATRHEDAVASGTPDVSWGARKVNGWLELKAISNWPKNDKTVVPIDLRPAQRVFLLKRSIAGGHCAVFIHVLKHDEYYLFDEPKSLSRLGVSLKRDAFYGPNRLASVGTRDWLPEPTRFLDVLTGIRRYGEL